VREAFAREAGVDLDACLEREAMAAAARAKGYAVEADTTWEQLYHQIFLNEIEGRLGRPRPTILYDYPVSMAALARARPDDPRYAERFELYVAGVELGNAFGELTDPVEQRRRLELEREERRAAGRTIYDLDEDFLDALVAGVPPSAGIAVGVDRLVMLLTDQRSIHDVLWFPADQLFEVGND
jgi:lysyl-tRNA synthetase class 2